jgi:hypothetical protein
MKVWSNIKIAVRVALRMDMNSARDDWHDLYDRIRSLMAAYTASPEGEGVPMTIREGLIMSDAVL